MQERERVRDTESQMMTPEFQADRALQRANCPIWVQRKEAPEGMSGNKMKQIDFLICLTRWKFGFTGI